MCVLTLASCVFFFKQNTAYEVRIGDWSSDVCSSDRWIEVSSSRRLVTRSVTVSPSRQRSVGAGSMPLTVVAMRGAPVRLAGVCAISRLNSVPDSTALCAAWKSEEHTSELQSLMRISYAVFCLKKKKKYKIK